MKKKPEKTDKEARGSLSRLAVDATKILVAKAAEIAALEFSAVEFPKKPKGMTTREFTEKIRPTKSFVQASRRVKTKKIEPGYDGMVSFAILMAPMALILAILISTNLLGEVWAILFLFIYVILVAIPGAYLGLDAIYFGIQEMVKGGVGTIKSIFLGFWEFLSLLGKAVSEILILFFNMAFGFAKGAFEALSDYLVFGGVYLIFSLGIVLLMNYSSIELTSLTLTLLIVLIPALLPASIAQRWWKLRNLPTP